MIDGSPPRLLLLLLHTCTNDVNSRSFAVLCADVTDTADLKVIDRNYGRRPMSDEDQRYTAKLMAKHGLDQEVGGWRGRAWRVV